MKEILKKIFPILWLKKGFLLYNRLKISTIDRLFYRTYILINEEIILSEVKNPFLEQQIDLSRESKSIQKGFARWTDPAWTQDQYVIKIGRPVRIEPVTGWAIHGKRHLIYSSLGFSHAPYVRKPALFSQNKSPVVKLRKVISLRDTGEENYFHFFNDVLPKIWLLQEKDLIDPDASIVISEKLWDKEYFQYFITASELKKFHWYVQKGEWIEADYSLFCKPFTHTKRHWDKSITIALAALNRSHRYSDTRKIFLTRSNASLRYIENEKQLVPFLEKMGFKVVDPLQLSFLDQVALFSSAEVVIAIHGAGISNIAFRNGLALRVVEIFHPNEYLPFHYVLLSRIYNYDYFAFQGDVGLEEGRGGFQVDIKAFEKYYLDLIE